jgi:hypothetical protein
MDEQFGEMLDTTPEGRTTYFAALARLTPVERARRVVSLCRTARALARAGIRRSQPDASPTAVELELIARLYGSAVARRLAPFVRAARG